MFDKKKMRCTHPARPFWRAGTEVEGLETSLRPRDRSEAYGIQAALENYSTASLFGWKIAATSEAGQKHINVDGPMAGRILRETVIADGPARPRWPAMKCASPRPEFAFRMQTDPPRRAPLWYTVRDVLRRPVSTRCIRRSEIPDSRFRDFVSAGAEQIIADNACAHLFVLGAPTTSNWRALDLVEEKPAIALRGKQYTGLGKNVLGDPEDFRPK